MQVAPAGETGRRVTEDGLLANSFPAERRAPAVLVLGSSVGGLSPEMSPDVNVLRGTARTPPEHERHAE
jgi:hypothetical protein